MRKKLKPVNGAKIVKGIRGYFLEIRVVYENYSDPERLENLLKIFNSIGYKGITVNTQKCNDEWMNNRISFFISLDTNIGLEAFHRKEEIIEKVLKRLIIAFNQKQKKPENEIYLIDYVVNWVA